MFLQEVRQQTHSVEQMCQAYIEAMESVKRSILEFTQEEQLQGQTYDSAKAYFQQTYIPLADGIILLSEAVQRAHQQLPERYVMEVDTNDLESDILQAQLDRIESFITSMESLHNANPLLYMHSASIVSTFRQTQTKIQEKLNRLITFDSTSVRIFAEIDQIAADVHAGLMQVHGGGAWNASARKFQTNQMDLSWSNNIQDKKINGDLESLEQTDNHLNEEHKEVLIKLAREYPEADVPTNLIQYIQGNEDNPLVQAEPDDLHATIEQAKSGEVQLNEFVYRLFNNEGTDSIA